MVMAHGTLPETSDRFAATDRELDLLALMGLSADQRAHLDDDPHGQLRLDERCFVSGAMVMPPHFYPSFVAALEHVDYLYAMTPLAFTADRGPIRLVLSEVASC
jgi:hypothetical protein